MKISKLLSAVVAAASTLFVALSARAEFTCELSFPSAPATALSNFPVLVRVSESSLDGFYYADAPTGGCVWFTDANDDAIPCDVDTWDDEGESLIWVSVPSFSSSATITMHWDAAGAPAGLPAASQVWSRADYVGVWHMNELLEDNGLHYTPDASASGWHAYKANENDAYPVTISDAGNAVSAPPTGHAMVNQLGGNRSIGGFTVPASATSGTTIGANGFTVSFFEESVNTGNDRAFALGGTATGGNRWNNGNVTAGKTTTYIMNANNGGYGNFTYSDGLADNAWRHIAGVFDSTPAGYVGGVSKTLQINSTWKPESVSKTLSHGIGLGTYADHGETFTGYLDEMRLRNVASTGEWIAEEYKTVTTANYVSFGDVEGGGGAAVIRLGAPETVEVVGMTATLAGRLSKLGDGATAADIYLAYTDGGATTNMVSVGTVSTEPAYFTNTVSGLSYSTEYTFWFMATNNAVPAAFTNSVAATFRTEARDRMLRYTGAMIRDFGKRDVGTAEAVATRLQDGIPSQTGTGSDVATYISLDFGATYRITKIVYAGRPANNTNTRLRGCEFKSSTDDETFTTFFTVPNDYTQDVTTPFITTNDLYISGNAPSGRFFYVGPINTGSWEECQFWTDSSAIIVSAPSFTGESTSGATATTAVTLDGDFSANATATLTAYVAASDLGPNPAAWQSGATPVNCGTVASGGTWSGTIPAVAAGANNYVRFLAIAETVEGTMISEFSAVASSFKAVSFVENRPFVESSASMLSYYPGTIAQAYKAFDNDETTAGGNNSAAYGALDYGRVVRIDRVRIVSSGVNSIGIPIQTSQDGWTWTTVTNRIADDGLAVNIDLAEPVVARYVRFGGDGTWQPTPQINEIRTYSLDGEAFVSVTNVTATHTAAGLVVSGTVTGENLAVGAKVSIYAYVGPQDYGSRKADWDAAGISPTLIGQYSVGAGFTTSALTGTANATSGIRYGAVVAVASGAASSMGTAHPFTLNDETLLDITQDMVVTNYSNQSLVDTWKQGFWGTRSIFFVSDDRSNGAATFGGKPYRITMIEWHDRLEGNCTTRAGQAKFRIYPTENLYTTDGCTDIALASSAWGSGTLSIHCNRWNAVAPAEKAVGFGVGIYNADHGNGHFRFWGSKASGRGLTIYIR